MKQKYEVTMTGSTTFTIEADTDDLRRGEIIEDVLEEFAYEYARHAEWDYEIEEIKTKQ